MAVYTATHRPDIARFLCDSRLKDEKRSNSKAL